MILYMNFLNSRLKRNLNQFIVCKERKKWNFGYLWAPEIIFYSCPKF